METPVEKPKHDYTLFNKFQTAFYTNVIEFEKYSNYEIKRFGTPLLVNIQKGFPHLSDEILNLYSFSVKALESPAILIALQRTKFINNFSYARVPQYIYYKSSTKKAKVEKDKKIVIPKGLMEFDTELKAQIMDLFLMDSKTFEYLKNSDKIQAIGKQLLGQIMENNSIKQSLKKRK